MTASQLSLAAMIVLLFPMFYFQVASLTFFLRPMGDPVVTWLMRGLFNTWLLGVVILGTVAVIAFASAGSARVALGLAAVAGCAALARRWFLARLDVQIRARDGGDATAIRRLRRLHLGGIAYNAIQLALLIPSLSGIFPTAV
jgi:hypothetical protein